MKNERKKSPLCNDTNFINVNCNFINVNRCGLAVGWLSAGCRLAGGQVAASTPPNSILSTPACRLAASWPPAVLRSAGSRQPAASRQ